MTSNSEVLRVFLDTNVVLTGALYPNGPAGSLSRLSDTVSFLHSQYVLEECDHLLCRDAPSELVGCASTQIDEYLKELDSKLVSECPPPDGAATNDEKDDPILGAAMAAKADLICTYNLDDFAESPLECGTPLAVHRKAGDVSLENYIQPVVLSSRGTLFYFGAIHHKSSMGPIIRSSNGTTVTCDKEGYIVLCGEHVNRSDPLKALEGGRQLRLTLRYNESDFEAALWEKSGEYWEKEIISRGSAAFLDDTSPILCFVPNHSFNGTIQCISGVPYFSRDRQIRRALDNYSLEANFGSLNLREYFIRLQST